MSWGRVEVARSGDGPPVVLLHRDLGPYGWGALVAELAATHTVFAVTLPGFGGSDLPPWARSVGHLASLTGHVLDAIGVSGAPVVGLGFGGWVAAALAATSPSRVGALALVSPMGCRPEVGEVVDQFLFSARAYAQLSLGADTPLESLFEADPGADHDELLDRSREAVTRVAWKPIGHDPALPGLLADVSLPALIVWGALDGVVPPQTARRWASVLRTDRVVTIEDGAHHVEVSHAVPVARAISSFLDGVAENRG